MDQKTSMSDASGDRAFYLPATAALGRLERWVSSAVRDRSRLVEGPVDSEEPRPFYVPAMAVVSAAPGRVERFVSRRLRNHDVRGRVTAVRDHVREYYLPATFRP